jgi:hypothetical protein
MKHIGRSSALRSASRNRKNLKLPKELALRIIYRNIADLHLDPQNPRRHSQRQIDQLAQLILAVGFLVPVLIDLHGNVLAGHARIRAAQAIGMLQVPTIGIDHLTESQRRAFVVADNRLAENSEWDFELLAEQLKILSEAELDFDLEITGFETAELDLLIESVSPESKHDNSAEDIPQPSQSPVSREGDTWVAGNSFLHCGSALDPRSYELLLKNKRADMVLSDPPYNVPVQGHIVGRGKIRHREFKMASGEMSEKEFTEFLSRAFSQMVANSKNGSLHYLFIDWRHLSEMLAAGRHAYAELKNVCIWDKQNAGLGSFYRSQHEMIFIYKTVPLLTVTPSNWGNLEDIARTFGVTPE